jgi:hypothetical protein
MGSVPTLAARCLHIRYGSEADYERFTLNKGLILNADLGTTFSVSATQQFSLYQQAEQASHFAIDTKAGPFQSDTN